MWVDSDADTAGEEVIKVTRQFLEESMEARRRKGVRWPIPAHGNRAM